MLLHSVLIGVAALAARASAQAASSATPTATSSSAATTHTIAVGATGFRFEPNNITANVGDILEYNFYPGGHSVVRADFKTPCIPYELTGVNRVGFFSGTQNPAVYTNNGPKYRVRVNDTAPIFFYCSAPGSCVDQHMIGVVNQNSTWTLEIQEEFVKNATFQVTPGDPLPSETASPTNTPSATSSPAASTTSGSSASTGDDDHSHLTAGQIAGIAIGAAAVLVLAGALIYICGRQSRRPERQEERNSFAPAGAMVDAKYASPKSPGQDGFHYSMAPGSDPYRSNNNSPPMHQHYPNVPSPPIVSPGHPTYQSFQSMDPRPDGPLMAGMEGRPGYYDANAATRQQHSPSPHPRPDPVELPTSGDPGNSPLPGYKPPRHFSWAQGAETGYRPGGKP